MEEEYGMTSLPFRQTKKISCSDELYKMVSLYCSDASTNAQDIESVNTTQQKPQKKSFYISLMERKNKVNQQESKINEKSKKGQAVKKACKDTTFITDYFQQRKRTTSFECMSNDSLQKQQQFTFDIIDSNSLSIDINESTFDGYNASNSYNSHNENNTLAQKRTSKLNAKKQKQINKINLTNFKVFGREESSLSSHISSPYKISIKDQVSDGGSYYCSQNNLSLLVSADVDSLQPENEDNQFKIGFD